MCCDNVCVRACTMTVARSLHRRSQKAHKPLGRPVWRWEVAGKNSGVDWVETTVCCCEHGNEHVGCTRREFLGSSWRFELPGLNQNYKRHINEIWWTYRKWVSHNHFCVSRVTTELTNPSIRPSYFIRLVGNIVTRIICYWNNNDDSDN